MEATSFREARSRLDDARHHYEQLTVPRDARAVKAAASSLLNALYSCWETLEREGTHAVRKEPGRPRAAAWKNWLAAKWDVIENDPLLRWARDARGGEVHGSRIVWEGQTHVSELSTENLPPAPPGAALVINFDGAHWLLDRGLPTERLQPIRHPGVTTALRVAGMPDQHLGQPTPDGQLERFALLLHHYESLVASAAVWMAT